MARIKLKQSKGVYGLNNLTFVAGKIYEVDNKVARYLVVRKKVADEVDASGKIIPPNLNVAEELPKEKQSAISRIPSFQAREGQIKVALVRLGGIGDTLELAAFASAVKRRFPNAHTTLFVRDKGGQQIIENHPAVDHVIISGDKQWFLFVDALMKKDFDIIYDNRYMVKVLFPKGIKGFEQYAKDTAEALKPYEEFFNIFPLKNNILTNIYKGSNRALSLQTACLKGFDDDLMIHLSDDDFNMSDMLQEQKYVTMHNGADIARQTKCWDAPLWNKVVEGLKKMGYAVIQLGGRFEDKVEGTIQMQGKTSLQQTTALISRAEFHVDTEGGLVHIARAVRTRSVVLFGPTPANFFSYDCNVNIQTPYDCKDCWWSTDYWWRECPKGYPMPPKCMDAITPEIVLKGISQIIKLKPMSPREEQKEKISFYDQWAIEMPLNEGHYKAEKWQWDRIYTMMDRVKGPKVLEIGAGDGYCAKVLGKRGFDVMATEVSQVRLDRMKKDKIKCKYADVNNLPFPDDTFDSVICGEVLEHIPIMGKGLEEVERVCKPDGRIIISLPVSPAHDEFKGHLWSIRHHGIYRKEALDMIVLTLDRIHRDAEKT